MFKVEQYTIRAAYCVCRRQKPKLIVRLCGTFFYLGYIYFFLVSLRPYPPLVYIKQTLRIIIMLVNAMRPHALFHIRAYLVARIKRTAHKGWARTGKYSHKNWMLMSLSIIKLYPKKGLDKIKISLKWKM